MSKLYCFQCGLPYAPFIKTEKDHICLDCMKRKTLNCSKCAYPAITQCEKCEYIYCNDHQFFENECNDCFKKTKTINKE